jgi:hypothetical protein
MLTDHPVVARSRGGARTLGDRYWAEVARFARGLLRVAVTARGVELRLLPRGPRLLVLGPAQLTVSERGVACSYAIVGGVLTRRAGGLLSLAQTGEAEVELRSTITGFFPALGRGPGWAGPLYGQVQSRLHVLISRRYFLRLIHARQP